LFEVNIKILKILVPTPPIKNIDKGSFGFSFFYTKCCQKVHVALHLMGEPCLKKWNMDEFHLSVNVIDQWLLFVFGFT
jgi:hypothetical protein